VNKKKKQRKKKAKSGKVIRLPLVHVQKTMDLHCQLLSGNVFSKRSKRTTVKEYCIEVQSS